MPTDLDLAPILDQESPVALDDQLAALAAGELDDDTARALRARVAADPALARRLARHEQLQRLLAGWEAPAMSEQGVRRLQARVEEALAALGDEPLEARRPRTTPPTAAVDSPRSAEPDGVADLDDARRGRRGGSGEHSTPGWPGWSAGVAVAAVLAAIVGTGVVLGGLPGGADLDMLASDDTEESADVAAEDGGAESFSDGAAESAPAEQSLDEEAGADADTTSEQRARLGPTRRVGVVVAEGELLALVETTEATPAERHEEAGDGGGGSATAEDGDEAATAEDGEQCVEQALRRDTTAADGRDVWLLAEGTYADQDAVFVVVRTPRTTQDGGGHRYEVLAYDPGDCSLLARDETAR